MTRKPAPDSRPVGLTIAGSDSGGGAGIQADLKAMEAAGVFGTSVITAVTAQNTMGVESSHVLPITEIEAQLAAVLSDFDVDAIKTGMLATEPVIRTVEDGVRDRDTPLIVDPVMVAATGDRLLESAAEDAYEDLIASATLVTPNADEATVLTGIDVADTDGAEAAGEMLVDLGAQAALVKGGHVPGDEIRDVLVTKDGITRYRHPRVATEATHGSGCTLASTIAAGMARGEAIQAAVETGLEHLQRAVRYNVPVGEGPGSVHHLATLRNRASQGAALEGVRTIVRSLENIDVGPLVPEVGMNVAVASLYAETPAEVAAVDGRITRTRAGIDVGHGVAMGVSNHIAGFLLASREFEPDLHCCLNCRLDEAVEATLQSLDWPVGEYDSATAQAATAGHRAAHEVFSTDGTPPVAVIDRGADGKEPQVWILSEAPQGLIDRITTLREAIEPQ